MTLSSVRFLVLDEADEMLSMGFYEEVSAILAQVPKERETMLFSATLPPGVEGIIYRHQKEPKRLTLSSDSMLVKEVEHAFYVSPSMEKARNLGLILLHEEPRSAIIFVNTRDEARTVTGHLRHEGFEAAMLSGELGQSDREKVMGAIKANRLRFMVATDVAARGIDISNLSHVIHYAVPENRDVYVHRSGRTGRIGRSGVAITLVGLRELPKWGEIQAMKGLTLEERKLPTAEEILEKQVDRAIYVVRHLEAGTLPPEEAQSGEAEALPTVQERFRIAAERLLEQGLSVQALAGLLQRALAPEGDEDEEDDDLPLPAPAAPAPPRREGGPRRGGPGRGGRGGRPRR
jgi:ATP-dependent RNA helicase DeaD